MSRRERIRKKISPEYNSTPTPTSLQPYRLKLPIQAQSTSQGQPTPSISEQLEKASRFGYNGLNVPVDAPGISSLPVQRKEAFGELGNLSELSSIERVDPVFNQLNQFHEKQPLQSQLTVGQPGDKYEQEADSVAVQVVNQINAREQEQTPSLDQADSQKVSPLNVSELPIQSKKIIQCEFSVDLEHGGPNGGGAYHLVRVRIGDRPPAASVPLANDRGYGSVNHITAWQLIERQVRRAVERQLFANAIANLNQAPFNCGLVDPGNGDPMGQMSQIRTGIRSYLTAQNANGANLWRGNSDIGGNVQGGAIAGLQGAIEADEQNPLADPTNLGDPACHRGYRLLNVSFDPPRAPNLAQAAILPLMQQHMQTFLSAYPQFAPVQNDFMAQWRIDMAADPQDTGEHWIPKAKSILNRDYPEAF